MGVPVGATGVRVLAGLEMLLGALALVVTSRALALGVAVSYTVFAVFTVVALVRETPIDSCGCLGRLETPPSSRHLLVIGVALVGALGEVAWPTPSMLERLGDDGGAGALFALGALMLAAAGVLAFRAGRRPATRR